MGGIQMFEELGISMGTAIVVLAALYFIIKWGVKNGITQFLEEEKQGKAIMKLLEAYKAKQDQHDNHREAP